MYIRSFSEPVEAVVKSTLNWYFLVDWLQPVVERIVLANPLKVKAIAEAKIMTDKIDAKMLTQLLRVDLIPACHISSLEDRRNKSLLRHRISMVRMRSRVKNKIHSLLARNAIVCDEFSDLFGKSGIAYLEGLSLPLPDKWILREQLGLIRTYNEIVAKVDDKIRDRLKVNEEANIVMTMPGIGTFFALLITSEIGGITRFKDAKSLCAYAGLVPSVFSSGGMTRMGSLINQNNKWLRWGMV